MFPHGLAVRIPGFHPGSPGSTPGVGKQLYFILCLFLGSPGQGRCWPAGMGPAQAAKVARAGAQDRGREAEGQSQVCQPREKMRGRFHCCLERRQGEDFIAAW